MKWYSRKYMGIMLILLLIALPAFSGLMAQESADEEAADDAAYEAQLEAGEKVYEVRCLLCHGAEGDGAGLIGAIRRVEMNGRMLEIMPRDLTLGVYRFRTTPTGCLPDDSDLLAMINNGVSRSFMPSHKELLTEDDGRAVAEYIKTFSERFEEEDPCDPIAVEMPDWMGNDLSIAKGEKIYKNMKCWECHGDKGTGDGPKAEELKDDWGKQILPFNFATGDLKRGSSPENVYITFTTGLDGTGMPSYEDSLNEEDRWHLVSFTLKLMGKLDKEEH